MAPYSPTTNLIKLVYPFLSYFIQTDGQIGKEILIGTLHGRKHAQNGPDISVKETRSQCCPW